MKHLLIGSLVALLPFTAAANIYDTPDSFSDVPDGEWFAPYVYEANVLGVINGYKTEQGQPTGKFGPDDHITFAQALKIGTLAAGIDPQEYDGVQLYSEPAKHWGAQYFRLARGKNYVFMKLSGGPEWYPDQILTRGSLAMMFDEIFSADIVADGILSGDTDANGRLTGDLRLDDPINRAEVAKIAMLVRARYGKNDAVKYSNRSASYPGLFLLGQPSDAGDYELLKFLPTAKIEHWGSIPLHRHYEYTTQYHDGSVYYATGSGELVIRNLETGNETTMLLPETQKKEDFYEPKGLSSFVIGANNTIVYTRGTCTTDGLEWSCDAFVYDMDTKKATPVGSIEDSGIFSGAGISATQNGNDVIGIRSGGGDGPGSFANIFVVDTRTVELRHQFSEMCGEEGCTTTVDVPGEVPFRDPVNLSCGDIPFGMNVQRYFELGSEWFDMLLRLSKDHYVGCIQ